MKKKKKFQQLDLNAYGYKVGVRRDKRRARPSMTKVGYMDHNPSLKQHNDDRTGNWKKWWREGCGTYGGMPGGRPVCSPGHAYYVEKIHRGLHRGSKIYGRRRERRKNKKIDMDE
jgi:hypothetical protein